MPQAPPSTPRGSKSSGIGPLSRSARTWASSIRANKNVLGAGSLARCPITDQSRLVRPAVHTQHVKLLPVRCSDVQCLFVTTPTVWSPLHSSPWDVEVKTTSQTGLRASSVWSARRTTRLSWGKSWFEFKLGGVQYLWCCHWEPSYRRSAFILRRFTAQRSWPGTTRKSPKWAKPTGS